MVVLVLLVVAVGPPLILHLIRDRSAVAARLRALARRAARRPSAPTSQPPTPPSGRSVPIERLAADLRRLSAELDRTSLEQRLPGQMHHMRATMLAYDATLLDACTAIGAPADARPPLHDLERLEMEATLAQAGLRW